MRDEYGLLMIVCIYIMTLVLSKNNACLAYDLLPYNTTRANCLIYASALLDMANQTLKCSRVLQIALEYFRAL